MCVYLAVPYMFQVKRSYGQSVYGIVLCQVIDGLIDNTCTVLLYCILLLQKEGQASQLVLHG